MYVNYSVYNIQRMIPKKTGFFKEQIAGFSAQIHRVSLTKTWFLKKGMLCICMYVILNLQR